MNDAALLEKFISAIITTLVIGFLGGGIAFGWWMLKLLLTWRRKDEDAPAGAPEHVLKDDCKDTHSQSKRDEEDFKQEMRDGFRDVRAGFNTFKTEVRDDISSLRTRFDLHMDKPAKVSASDSQGS